MLVVLLGSALLVGCKHTSPSTSQTANAETAKKKSPDNAGSKSGSKTASTSARESTASPKATPINETSGKVAAVNTNLRFVVIDFALNPLPVVDQRLGVYRHGQKVGELKISAQSRNSIVAADITAGDAQKGDEVRPD